MPASTLFQRIVPIFLQIACLLAASSQVFAAEEVVVESAEHPVWQVSDGISALMCEQLNDTGLLHAVRAVTEPVAQLDTTALNAGMYEPLRGVVDQPARYRLSIEVLFFDVTTRDNRIDLGRDFNDLSRMFGGSDELAECRLHIRLQDERSGQQVIDNEYTGRESRHGVRLGHLSRPRLKEMNYLGAQFHESNLGLATYKALGEFLLDLYNNLPLQGSILAVQGDVAVVSLGDGQLVAVGDELSVLDSNAVLDRNGNSVWDQPLKLATLRVLELRADRCLCLILDGQLALAEGAAVRPVILRWNVPDETDHQAARELLY